MLTQLKLKNWRSIRDATIKFTPLTVLIGANSSGKSNIIESLYFLRNALDENDYAQALYAASGIDKLRSVGAGDDPVSLELELSEPQLTYKVTIEDDFGVVQETLFDQEGEYARSGKFPTLLRTDNVLKTTDQNEVSPLAAFYNTAHKPIQDLVGTITQRWQLLDENFMPPLSISAGGVIKLSVIDRCADNVPMLLDYMQKRFPATYDSFQDDLSWLLSHVKSISTKYTDIETRMSLKEITQPDQEAPTVSAGTRRLIAMLAAYYVLEMQPKKFTDLPGLIVIEEPDTALHPLLLDRLIELFRIYADPEQNGGKVRQFIMTTHNPQFLNYFKPEEVRVVNRDEATGETQIDNILEHLSDTWLTHRSLGDAWLSRLIGGIPSE